MDRIPTTTNGSLDGNRETAPIAGTQQGRLGERRVSQAPQSARPHLLEVYEPGSGGAPAEVQTDIPTRTVTEAPASKRLSGATAMPQPGPGQDDPIQPSPAGDVRGQPGTLSGPDPKPSYRTRWNAFVRWCKRTNVQHCPAIPDTVASYLKACAPRNGFKALRTIRAAISSSHCAAGCEDPCTTNLVRTTFKELGRVSRESGARKMVVTRVPLKPAQIEAIRAVAFERRPVGQRIESLQETRRRGRVDVALCSAILETGLQYQYVAALEWRDVGVDENLGTILTIRAQSGGPDAVIAISERAYRDLMALAPRAFEQNERIFQIGVAQIGNRIRAMKRVASSNSRIAGSESLWNQQAETHATPGSPSGATPMPFSGATPMPFSSATPMPFSGATPMPFSSATPMPFSGAMPGPSFVATPLPFYGATPGPSSSTTPGPNSGATPGPSHTAAADPSRTSA